MTEEYVLYLTEENLTSTITEETIAVNLQGDVIVNTLPNQVSELLEGTINGMNTSFSTTMDFIGNTTQVFLNGVKQIRNIDYTESPPNVINMANPPDNTGYNDVLEIVDTRNINGSN